MKEIFGENMVFHTKAQIINNNNSNKIYDNILVIKDNNFDKFLQTIVEEEEIEEIKFKLKRKPGKEGKRYQTYSISINSVYFHSCWIIEFQLVEHYFGYYPQQALLILIFYYF
jgi:hypothetical protein